MKRARGFFIVGLIAVSVAPSAGCRSPYYADQGAALGGLAGGLTGAALGDAHGAALGGAAVGTAVGALAGAAIGDSMDAEVARRQALIEAKTGRRMAGTATTADVTAMVTSGLSDDVIITHVRTHGVAAPLTTTEIIRLHESGVSEKVINAMQEVSATQASLPPVAYATPVVIEQPYMAPPVWYARPYWHGGGPYCRPAQPGVSWGFSYSR